MHNASLMICLLPLHLYSVATFDGFWWKCSGKHFNIWISDLSLDFHFHFFWGQLNNGRSGSIRKAQISIWQYVFWTLCWIVSMIITGLPTMKSDTGRWTVFSILAMLFFSFLHIVTVGWVGYIYLVATSSGPELWHKKEGIRKVLTFTYFPIPSSSKTISTDQNFFLWWWAK